MIAHFGIFGIDRTGGLRDFAHTAQFQWYVWVRSEFMKYGGDDMATTGFRALVVDDEAAVRRLMMLALRKERFECDGASDGIEAERLVLEKSYDLVITDLRMPNKHGHALATFLLEMERRPVILVHTGVVEPRLAKDLLTRGVDDILFKPTDFGFLAAKARALVERVRAEPSASAPGLSHSETDALQEVSPDGPVPLPLLLRKLGGMLKILPVSKAAFDVYTLISTNSSDIPQVAAAMQRDAALCTDVLRLANSSFYNPTGERITCLEKATIMIGQKTIAELALATNALSALTPGLLPWLDVELTWKRSLAAGIALESLADDPDRIDSGMMLSAIMHPLGRIALGTLFPKHYDSMLALCRQHGETLQEQERRIFPMLHTEVLAHLLSSWNIPVEIFNPLKFATDDYSAIARLADPMRRKAEMIKLAIFIGNLASGRWEDWDVVQFPPANVLTRLKVRNLLDLVERTREDVRKLAEFRPEHLAPNLTKTPNAPLRSVPYCRLLTDGPDLLPPLLHSLGLRTENVSLTDLAELTEPAIVNCLGADPARLVARRKSNNSLIAVCEPERFEIYQRFARAVEVPNSFGRIRSVLASLDSVKPHEARGFREGHAHESSVSL